MADIRCSHCGNNNPDFFDVCQFCQSPLKSESMLHAGEVPSEKDTDELEPILPEWLQDARQQSRDSVDDDTFSPETKPKIQSVEPIDLLAELASQDDLDEEDEVPDWLASINPVEDKKSILHSAPDEKEEPSDFFAQFSQTESKPPAPLTEQPSQNDAASLMGGMKSQESDQVDKLTDWLSQTPSESSEPITFDQGETASEDNSWMRNLGSTETSKPESPAEKEPEDLTWLHNLETASKQTGELSSTQADSEFDFSAAKAESSGEDLSWLDNIGGTPAPAPEDSTPSKTESLQEDLNWLNNLGGTPAPSAEEPTPAQAESSSEDLSWLNNLGDTSVPASEEPTPVQSESSSEDLSWLNNLGDTPAPAAEEPTPAQSESSSEDLSWLNNLGDTPAPAAEESTLAQAESSSEDLSWLNNLGDTPAPAAEEPAPVQSESSSEDLSWLNNLGDTPAPANEESASLQTESSQDDSSWMKNLGEGKINETSETPTIKYTPAGTAPLKENAGRDSTPDWLKSAMEEPSMPAPGDLSMEWFADHEKSTKSEATPEKQEMPNFQTDDSGASIQDEPATVSQKLDLPSGDSFTTSSQDVDAMFNIDIPDWVSQETDEVETSPSESANFPASGDETLAPVELPSWVQAMRPVDSAIAETSFVNDDEQEAESEGPLAGFRGVIPSAPIGSSLRPKAFSMKLQVTDEQQAGASLIEQIIAGETTVHPAKPAAPVASQSMLRWILSALFIVLLGLVIGSGSQSFAIVAPGRVSQLSNLIGTIPDGSPVLMVIDYEPAVAGELAAAAGPVLDQLALSRHATFTFLSMSPNGSALVEYLMSSTNISRPAPDGLGYQVGIQYFNAGFLPGGSAGVLGFIDDPVKIMPNAMLFAKVGTFSNFEAVVLMTDNADSGRVWVEQLEFAKQLHPEIASKPLIVVSSAQAGPMLEPYVSSEQVDVLVSGLSDAAKYEYVNQSRPGIARAYWDSFGVGLILAVMSIILGGIWNIVTGIRERRTEADQV